MDAIFTNLYIQTEYSFLKSNIAINKLDKLIADNQIQNMAICDDAMYGVIKFYKTCLKSGVKPIIGLRVEVSDPSIHDTLLLYAKNNQGYKALMKISSMAQINKNKLTYDYLNEVCCDIVCVVPIMENRIQIYYNNKNNRGIDDYLTSLKKMFHSLYLGISLQTEDLRRSASDFINIGARVGLDCVAINKTSYLKDEDAEVYQVLRCIKQNVKNYELSELERNLAYLDNTEISLLFKDYPTLITNTQKIANECSVKIEFGKYKFPSLKLKMDSSLYLNNLCKIGLNKRLKNISISNSQIKVYRDRLIYELDVIRKMGFSDYFLIVYDYVKYAKTHDIYVGCGRGSAGGSLVSYSLGITEVDPIKYGLLFERFLNIERISMPDIDVDFEDERRDDLIHYLGEHYTKMRVSHISTFGTFKARLAIRDVARVKQLDEVKLKEIIKRIPSYGKNIASAIQSDPTLAALIKRDTQIADVVNVAMSIEGLPRNISTHAAGIIMTDRDLVEYTPLQEGIDGLYQTQYEAHDLENLGLVKMDILGLRNLSIIKKVVKTVKIHDNIDINLNNIPLDDRAVYKMISQGNTLGIFQLESPGVRKLLINLQTSCLNDIINATSLYRPGPMDIIPSFLKRKNGLEKVTYADPSLEEILHDTYGFIVYQEQIMQIATKFASFTLGEADILRRAISKKKLDVMQSMKQDFINKAQANGKSYDKAIEVYTDIEKFASYGFNKSHAVSYSIIAYQMSYLKVHFTKAFLSALLSNAIGSPASIRSYISEAKKYGVKVLSPSINSSDISFTYNKDGIIYALSAINGIGNIIANQIVEERKAGLFKDFSSFLDRTKSFMNKRVIASLVNAGCFDEMGLTHKYMNTNYEALAQKASYSGIINIDMNINNDSKTEYTFDEISRKENDALGFNLKYSVFIKYGEIIKKYNVMSISDLTENKEANCLFVINRIKEIRTKKGDKMVFLSVYDDSGVGEAVVFPTVYEKWLSDTENVLEVSNVILSQVRAEKRNENIQLICNTLDVLK